MTQESNQDLVGQDESQVFERKKSLADPCEGLKSLCAMINAEPAQGTVVFGIAPDGEPVGVGPGNLDKAQRSLSQRIDSKFKPQLQPTIWVAELKGKSVVVLSATRNRDVAYHEFDGRAYIREGTVTRQLTLAEKQSLQHKRNRDLYTGPFKCDRCGLLYATLFRDIVRTDQGVRLSYACKCGGECWPVT